MKWYAHFVQVGTRHRRPETISHLNKIKCFNENCVRSGRKRAHRIESNEYDRSMIRWNVYARMNSKETARWCDIRHLQYSNNAFAFRRKPNTIIIGSMACIWKWLTVDCDSMVRFLAQFSRDFHVIVSALLCRRSCTNCPDLNHAIVSLSSIKLFTFRADAKVSIPFVRDFTHYSVHACVNVWIMCNRLTLSPTEHIEHIFTYECKQTNVKCDADRRKTQTMKTKRGEENANEMKHTFTPLFLFISFSFFHFISLMCVCYCQHVTGCCLKSVK